MANNEIIDQADKDRQTARKWYRWLWLSPLLTIPTLYLFAGYLFSFSFDMFCPGWGERCVVDYEIILRLSGVIAILVSSLWHLVLLIPARNKESLFVRLHGRQELILAGLRTAIPLIFALAFGGYGFGLYTSIIFLIPIWFFGTRWGQNQAARGDCSLMRWRGQADALPGPPEEEEFNQTISTDHLVNVIRFNKDPEKRQSALAELNKRGMVENL